MEKLIGIDFAGASIIEHCTGKDIHGTIKSSEVRNNIFLVITWKQNSGPSRSKEFFLNSWACNVSGKTIALQRKGLFLFTL